MLIAAATAIGGLVGLGLGYLFRLTEFRREQRLLAYGDFIAAFLSVAHSGAALFSVAIQQGVKFFAGENRAESAELWESFGEAAQLFEVATARLRLVGSDAVRVDSEVLEDFITTNIRNVPPLRRDAKATDWGVAAQTGPAKIDSEAVRLARAFADRSHGEITRWRSAQKHTSPLH